MKKIFIALISLLSFSAIRAQSSFDSTTFYANSNYVYGNLDKAKVTTGLLREYGIDFLNQDNYNGKVLHDSNWVNLTDWRLLYGTLYSQQFTTSPTMLYLDEINNRLAQASTGNLPVSFVGLDYYFQGLDTNAVNNGQIHIINGRLYDGGLPQARIKPILTPYITYEAFAFATTQQYLYTGSNQFIFKSNLFFSNTGKTISQVEVDPFGTGSYQTVSFDVPFTVNYPSSGLIPMVVKMSFTDGSINYSHTKMAVYPSPGITRYNNPFATNETITATKPYLGVLASGDITIELAENNFTGQIRKPLIVVEGFDPDGQYRYWPDYLNNINFDPNTVGPQTITLNQGLDDINDYDMIFVHYGNGTDYIQRNAFLLEAVIANINARKTFYNGVRQQNVIIGMSMGGLVTRYALRDMELSSQNHETRLFISHDAPHWGANVPVAYQALVQHLAPWKIINVNGTFPFIGYQDLFPDAVDAKNLFNTPAAKQMLIQRYILGPAIFGDAPLFAENSTHTSFMNEINNMGWPSQCRNLTLSNGACNGTLQFPGGSQLLSIYGAKSMTYFGGLWRSLLITLGGTPLGTIATGGSVPINPISALIQFPLSLITTKGTLYFDFGGWATPNGGSSLIYKGDAYIKRQLFWGLFNTTSYILKCHANSVSGMLALDNAPGGVYDVNQFGLDVNNINNQLHQNLGNWINATILQPRFCFVPTVSSLAVTNPQQNLTTPICNNLACLQPAAIGNSFAPQTNQIHISYTQPSTNWILNNQDPNNNCVQICGAAISGNDIVCNSSVYEVTNLPPGATVTWSISPNYSVLQLAPNTPAANQLTITNQHWYEVSNVTLTASINGGNCLSFTKQIGNDNDGVNSGGLYWEQPSCLAGNVLHPSESGITSGATFVHQGCFVYVAISNSYTSVQSTGGTPMAYGLGTFVFKAGTPNAYTSKCLYFQLPLGSGGIPFTFTLSKGTGSCGKQLLFFSISNNGREAEQTFTVSPVPAKNNITITGIENFSFSAVKITDKTGTVKKQWKLPNKTKTVSLSIAGLPTNVYYVQVFNGTEWLGKSIIVQ